MIVPCLTAPAIGLPVGTGCKNHFLPWTELEGGTGAGGWACWLLFHQPEALGVYILLQTLTSVKLATL